MQGETVIRLTLAGEFSFRCNETCRSSRARYIGGRDVCLLVDKRVCAQHASFVLASFKSECCLLFHASNLEAANYVDQQISHAF
jgi:hypothetical protein